VAVDAAALGGEVRQLLAAEAVLGEGACWDAGRQCVWFVDIKQHRLWHYDPATGSNAMAEAPDQIGWALPADDGGLLCGLKDGLYRFDPEAQRFDKLSSVPGEPATNRLNDACTDPAGRVWFGSMDDGEDAASGRFYRFDRGTVTPAGPDGIAITNGPAVSPDGRLIYFTDTVGRRIMVADLSPDGSVSAARPFVAIPVEGTYPDGPVVDAEGHVWTGLWNGWSVARFAPDGTLVGQVRIPAANVTKLAFGGKDMKTVFVTTARKGLDAAALAAQPMAGSLFAFESPVAGAVQARVKMR
jgi:sugar lactone lactonase YvrE